MVLERFGEERVIVPAGLHPRFEAIIYFDQFHKDFAGDFHRILNRAFHVQASDSSA